MLLGGTCRIAAPGHGLLQLLNHQAAMRPEGLLTSAGVHQRSRRRRDDTRHTACLRDCAARAIRCRHQRATRCIASQFVRVCTRGVQQSKLCMACRTIGWPAKATTSRQCMALPAASSACACVPCVHACMHVAHDGWTLCVHVCMLSAGWSAGRMERTSAACLNDVRRGSSHA